MLSAEVAQFLAYEGLGTYDGGGISGTIFVEMLPESPDELIGIYSTGGNPSEACLPYDKPIIQAVIRGTINPLTSGAKAQQVFDALNGFHSGYMVDAGIWVLGVHAVGSGPTHIGRDENGRHEYSINFEFYVKNDNRRS